MQPRLVWFAVYAHAVACICTGRCRSMCLEWIWQRKAQESRLPGLNRIKCCPNQPDEPKQESTLHRSCSTMGSGMCWFCFSEDNTWVVVPSATRKTTRSETLSFGVQRLPSWLPLTRCGYRRTQRLTCDNRLSCVCTWTKECERWGQRSELPL